MTSLGSYFTTYYVQFLYGPGYILTTIIMALGAAGLFWNGNRKAQAGVLILSQDNAAKGEAADGRRRRALRKAWPGALLHFLLVACILWVAGFLFDSVYYCILGETLMDDLRLVLILFLSANLQKGWSVRTRILRGSVFFGCMQLALPVSEPFGAMIKNVHANYYWADWITPVIVAVMCVAIVMFLQKHSTETFTQVPAALTMIVVLVSVLAWVVWRLCQVLKPGRVFECVICSLMWVEIWLFYYVFYIASSQTQQNIELQAMQQKTQLDRELLDLTRQTYDDLHKTRHELKNHLIYMKMLAYKEEWDKLWNYLNQLGAQTEEMFTYVECGNEVVNAVLNHSVGKARAQGIRFETNLIVPPSLPYDEVDLCSLLSNLANNAIEAAAQVVQRSGTDQMANPGDGTVMAGADAAEGESGGDNGKQKAFGAAPVIHFSIYPQQDYLFIKVQNPFSPSVSRERRLSLQTTKKDAKFHGYGTKVIRQIAEKNNGSVSFDIEGDQFIATVMLDLRNCA